MFEYIKIVKTAKLRRTCKFDVLNRKSQDVIGRIFWHGRWRRYIFKGEPDCVFSEGCLLDIASFLHALMEERG